MQAYDLTISPSQATLITRICAVLSPRTDMWGAVTNTGYNGIPTSLGIVQMLIHEMRENGTIDIMCPPLTLLFLLFCTTVHTVESRKNIFYRGIVVGNG